MRIHALCFSLVTMAAQALEVSSPVPAAIRDRLELDPVYCKCTLVGGFPIVASGKVDDAALAEAAVIVKSMLSGRDDILDAMARNKVRLAVMAVSERTCDVPEHSNLTPRAYWNRRARGLGASPDCPVVSCGEENLLCLKGDPYPTENILVHEFAHAIHDVGLNTVDPTFDARLKAAYEAAKKEGKWKNCYAAENHHEYWAEAVQSWFGTNRQDDAIHNHVNTRQELIEYDGAVAKLCEEVFGENRWQYQRADDRARFGEAHLKKLDREKAPVFAFSEEEEKAARESGMAK